MAFDRSKNLIVCDIEVEAVLSIRPSGEIRVFSDRAGEMRLGFPNGAVFDADANVYISNSFDESLSELAASAAGSQRLSAHDKLVRLPNEKMAAEVRDQAPSGSLCRIRPDGRSDVIARGLYCPNGIAIDPDESAIFVLQSTINNCLRIPLVGHGTAEIYSEFESAPDGLAFDCEGDLVVTLPLLNRLVVVDQAGQQTILVDDPSGSKLDLPTNCAFGGSTFDDLYVGHVIADHIAKIPYGRQGHRLFHLR